MSRERNDEVMIEVMSVVVTVGMCVVMKCFFFSSSVFFFLLLLL